METVSVLGHRWDWENDCAVFTIRREGEDLTDVNQVKVLETYTLDELCGALKWDGYSNRPLNFTTMQEIVDYVQGTTEVGLQLHEQILGSGYRWSQWKDLFEAAQRKQGISQYWDITPLLDEEKTDLQHLNPKHLDGFIAAIMDKYLGGLEDRLKDMTWKEIDAVAWTLEKMGVSRETWNEDYVGIYIGARMTVTGWNNVGNFKSEVLKAALQKTKAKINEEFDTRMVAMRQNILDLNPHIKLGEEQYIKTFEEHYKLQQNAGLITLRRNKSPILNKCIKEIKPVNAQKVFAIIGKNIGIVHKHLIDKGCPIGVNLQHLFLSILDKYGEKLSDAVGNGVLPLAAQSMLLVWCSLTAGTPRLKHTMNVMDEIIGRNIMSKEDLTTILINLCEKTMNGDITRTESRTTIAKVALQLVSSINGTKSDMKEWEWVQTYWPWMYYTYSQDVGAIVQQASQLKNGLTSCPKAWLEIQVFKYYTRLSVNKVPPAIQQWFVEDLGIQHWDWAKKVENKEDTENKENKENKEDHE